MVTYSNNADFSDFAQTLHISAKNGVDIDTTKLLNLLLLANSGAEFIPSRATIFVPQVATANGPALLPLDRPVGETITLMLQYELDCIAPIRKLKKITVEEVEPSRALAVVSKPLTAFTDKKKVERRKCAICGASFDSSRPWFLNCKSCHATSKSEVKVPSGSKPKASVGLISLADDGDIDLGSDISESDIRVLVCHFSGMGEVSG